MGGMCFIDTLTRITVKMSWKDDALLCYHIPSLISKQQSICINLYSKLYFVSYYWWTLTKSTFLMCQKVRFFAKYPPPPFCPMGVLIKYFLRRIFLRVHFLPEGFNPKGEKRESLRFVASPSLWCVPYPLPLLDTFEIFDPKREKNREKIRHP